MNAQPLYDQSLHYELHSYFIRVNGSSLLLFKAHEELLQWMLLIRMFVSSMQRDVMSALQQLSDRVKDFSASKAQCWQDIWRPVKRKLQTAENTTRSRWTTKGYIYVLRKNFKRWTYIHFTYCLILHYIELGRLSNMLNRSI